MVSLKSQISLARGRELFLITVTCHHLSECRLAGFGDALRFHRCVVFFVYDHRILVRPRESLLS